MPLRLGNLFKSLPAETDREHVERILENGGMRIERIISRGQPSPDGFWYDQPTAEWVILLKGRATLSVAGEGRTNLVAGDYLLIPARLKHRVEQTSDDAIWLALHFGAERK